MLNSEMSLHSVYAVIVVENGVPIAHYAIERLDEYQAITLVGGMEPRDSELLREILLAAVATEGHVVHKDTLREMVRRRMVENASDDASEEEESPYPTDIGDIPF